MYKGCTVYKNLFKNLANWSFDTLGTRALLLFGSDTKGTVSNNTYLVKNLLRLPKKNLGSFLCEFLL